MIEVYQAILNALKADSELLALLGGEADRIFVRDREEIGVIPAVTVGKVTETAEKFCGSRVGAMPSRLHEQILAIDCWSKQLAEALKIGKRVDVVMNGNSSDLANLRDIKMAGCLEIFERDTKIWHVAYSYRFKYFIPWET